ncbi:uncharacterized protein LOC119980717 [Tripterygium wilfordii]|uniref:uncharacterized protein LOC119980717 n=1 Tax=Tripterygium wilfordii TaxID=458696 RepID=UPI0018F82CAA|nr:uncharacterized protein LOC119980717 [Tripterygium wilfordii]
MTSRRNQDFSYEYEYNYSQSVPWVDCTQTIARGSSSQHQLPDVNVTDVEVEDDERYIEFDDSEIEDDDDGNEGDLEVKQVLENKAELLNVVKAWHIENNYQYKTQCSNTEIIQLKCVKDNACRWYLRAKEEESIKMWMITVLRGPHTCISASLTQGHQQLDSEYLGSVILGIVRANLKICVAAIQAFASTQLKHEVSYFKAWMAKHKAIEKLFGSFEASYGVLPKFLGSLQMSNPSTVVHFEYKDYNNLVATFGRVFRAFRPSIDGSQYCCPLINIDGMHLYVKYKEKLLIVVAFDADNGLFPLCYALVDVKNNRNWAWFINCIRAYVTDCQGVCVLSD